MQPANPAVPAPTLREQKTKVKSEQPLDFEWLLRYFCGAAIMIAASYKIIVADYGSLILWRCRELNPSPNLAEKALLRRVVNVRFKAGCEERRRNHSCPIPYLNAPVGRPSIDSVDDSAHASGYRNPRGIDVAHIRPRPRRGRTQNPSYRSMETSRLQECSWQVCLLSGLKCHPSVHCVARLSRYRPSKPVTPLQDILQ